MLVTNTNIPCVTNVVRKIFPYREMCDLELRKLIAEKSGLFHSCEIFYDVHGFDDVVGCAAGINSTSKDFVPQYEGSLDLMNGLELDLSEDEIIIYERAVNYMAKIEKVKPIMVSARAKAIAYLATKDFS